MRTLISIGLLTLAATTVQADDKVKAAAGGGIGGAVGAVIGEELGDREGAIIGAGIGAAVGVAVATDENKSKNSNTQPKATPVIVIERDSPPAHGRHCPPGQAKKGRC